MIPCLKQKTECVIIRADGRRYEATNQCAVDGLDICPRIPAGCATGTGYELCGSTHAEANAAALAAESKDVPGDSNNGSRRHNGVVAGWAVRRLTPRECERLQGFPDGYTDVPWRGKNWTPDGPRYKGLGNSMAVNAMRWLGHRIEHVSALSSHQLGQGK